MSNKTQQQSETAIATTNENQGLMQSYQTAIHAPENFDLAFAELNAEFEQAIKVLGVGEIISPTSLLDSLEPLAVSPLYNLTDAFPFEIEESGEPKVILIFVLNPVGSNDIVTVGQGVNTSRTKFVDAFNKARLMGVNLVMSNMQFVRLDKGKKAGNFPIILRGTANTKPIVTRK